MIIFHVVKATEVVDNKASTGEVLKHTENPEEKNSVGRSDVDEAKATEREL